MFYIGRGACKSKGLVEKFRNLGLVLRKLSLHFRHIIMFFQD
jgi:hypothetical protein